MSHKPKRLILFGAFLSFILLVSIRFSYGFSKNGIP